MNIMEFVLSMYPLLGINPAALVIDGGKQSELLK
jgi:hypothetical protein